MEHIHLHVTCNKVQILYVCMFKMLTAQWRSLTQQPVVAIRTALKPSLGTVFYQHRVQGNRQGRQRKGQL